jgi:hypothetical protein
MMIAAIHKTRLTSITDITLENKTCCYNWYCYLLTRWSYHKTKQHCLKKDNISDEQNHHGNVCFCLYLATSDIVFSIKHRIIESKPTCPLLKCSYQLSYTHKTKFTPSTKSCDAIHVWTTLINLNAQSKFFSVGLHNWLWNLSTTTNIDSNRDN